MTTRCTNPYGVHIVRITSWREREGERERNSYHLVHILITTYYSDRVERIEDCKEKNMVDWRFVGVRNSTVIRDNAIRRSERNDWYA